MTEQTKETTSIKQLKEFIEKAAKLGNYSANTAGGMLSPLKIVADGLTSEEPTDLDYIAEHLEQIFHRQTKTLNIRSASLQVYLRRVRRVIKDFKEYGTDAKKFHAWKPKITQRTNKNVSTRSKQSGERHSFRAALASNYRQSKTLS